MAKKADIGAKEFSKLLEKFAYSPNKTIVKRLDSKMFSLDLNKVYNYKPEHLAFQEFYRCTELFQKRNPGLSLAQGALRVAGLQKLIMTTEANKKAELEELAVQTIRDIYQVPEYVDMQAMIQPRISFDARQNNSAEPFLDLTLEQKNDMRDEIQKRIILNGLVHGSSMHVWKGVYHLIAGELDSINPDLKELYDYYTSALGITIWQLNPDKFAEAIWYMNPDNVNEENQHIAQEYNKIQLTQGFNKLQFNREQGFGGSVQVEGVNFPVLLHELNKGIIDWLISAGIPQNYTDAELKYYYAKADAYENEPWHYMLSPTLWVELLEAAQVDNEKIPRLISKLTQLSYDELVELFKMIQDNKEQATKKIKTWNL